MTDQRNRELVRNEAAEHGWKRETFAACDSFARHGEIAKIWWTDHDTATQAVRYPGRTGYASHPDTAEPRMAIVRIREWLTERP